MGKRLIIFGAGRNGYDAYNFFGKEHIWGYVDNNSQERSLLDKPIISFSEFKEMVNNDHDFSEKYEVIISVSITIWATFSIACQLMSIGINNYSVYLDVRKRWEYGDDFVYRDRAVFPYEQESILEIYRAQRNYLFRHTDPRKLLPATGELRKKQLDTLNRADDFFVYMRNNISSFSPFMIFGTLLGAVRHEGFIPWDDDLDFGIIFDEFDLMIRYLDKSSCVFRHIGNNVWVNNKNQTFIGVENKYIAALGLGYVQIYENIGAEHIKDNLFITDIMPLYFFRNGYSPKDYETDFYKWLNQRFIDFDSVDRDCLKSLIDSGIISLERTDNLGIAFDCSSFIISQISINGRNMNESIWDTTTLFPLRSMQFDGKTWFAPNDPIEWLKRSGYNDPMKLPDRVGVYVHDKDKIFREEY